ncbi:hypothetical protein J4226_06000 [Candidatus Pacearchaeota archaeon]|nr:hypothetical protein [Candidatus Pacearchaeota archaeon]
MVKIARWEKLCDKAVDNLKDLESEVAFGKSAVFLWRAGVVLVIFLLMDVHRRTKGSIF